VAARKLVLREEGFNVPKKLRDASALQHELAGCNGLCETLAAQTSPLLRGLAEMGLADSTLVVFSAEHGDMQGSHGLDRKGKPQEESLHIPLFMRRPSRIKPGQKTATLASSIDLMPTLHSLCGLKSPPNCVGRDSSGAVTGGRSLNVESVYAEGAMSRAKAAPERAAKGKKPRERAKRQ